MGKPVVNKVDHVGIVVSNIAAVAREYEDVLGAVGLGDVVFDPTQKVDIQFMRLPDGTKIELIQPVGDDSPVRRALEKGGGLNHLCFEVPDLDEAVDAAIGSHSICVCPPTPAIAFAGRRIAFVFNKQIGLIEFAEAPRD